LLLSSSSVNQSSYRRSENDKKIVSTKMMMQRILTQGIPIASYGNSSSSSSGTTITSRWAWLLMMAIVMKTTVRYRPYDDKVDLSNEWMLLDGDGASTKTLQPTCLLGDGNNDTKVIFSL
jgi:hypothetical protein